MKLLLIGDFDSRSCTSVAHLSQQLRDGFKAAGWHVMAWDMRKTNFPTCDAALYHAYFDSPAWQAFATLRTKVRKVFSFMESVNPNPCDHQFAYFQPTEQFVSPVTVIPVPLRKQGYEVLPKTRGSILLDHSADGFFMANDPQYDWTRLLWRAVTEHKLQVSQLGRFYAPDCPTSIPVLPVLPHQNYLNQTALFETFVTTHVNSYNHTAVDMAVRGSRVLVPVTEAGSFVPLDLVRRFGMVLCQSVDEVVARLQEPVTNLTAKLDIATDLSTAIKIMDHTMQLICA